MIECDICTNYFHADDIETCPECGIELCPSCYENHVTRCLSQSTADDDDDDDKYPHECPNCGEDLELDCKSELKSLPRIIIRLETDTIAALTSACSSIISRPISNN